MFLQSSREAPSFSNANLDKSGHIAAHFLLFGFIAFCLAKAAGHRSPKAVIGVIMIATLYGLSDELHQAIVPVRNASGQDLLVDMLGACDGAGIGQLSLKTRQNGAADYPSQSGQP